jgi:hypothetical protein
MSPIESTLSSNPNDSAAQLSGWERARRRLSSVLSILLCIEIGTFLLVLPWSEIWDRTWLLRSWPVLRPVMLSAYMRGAISGIGLVNLGLAISQAWQFRYTGRPPLPPAS